MKKFLLLFLIILNFSINLGMSWADIMEAEEVKNSIPKEVKKSIPPKNLVKKAKASLNQLERDFHFAVLHQKQPEIERLLEINPDLVNLPVGDFLPLTTAASLGDQDLVTFLLIHGANINGHTAQRHNALYWTITSRPPRDSKDISSFEDNKFKVACILLYAGIDIEFTTTDNSTALHSASFFGCNRILQLLLDCHINIKARNSLNKTALHCALINEKKSQEQILSTVRLLVEAGVDINAKAYIKEIECSALDLARSNNYHEIEDYLLANGAEQSNSNINPEMNQPDITKRGKIKNFNFAVFYQKTSDIEKLLEINPDLVNLPFGDFFPLATAASCGYKIGIELLLSKGADVNYYIENQKFNALHHVITRRKHNYHNDKNFEDDIFEIAYMLIRAGIDIEFESKNGFRALHMASYRCYHRIVQLLLDSKANIKATDKDHKTALHCALLHHYKPKEEILVTEEEILVTVKLLVEAGIDINAKAYISDRTMKNKKYKYKSALDLARDKKYKNIEDYLIANGAKNK